MALTGGRRMTNLFFENSPRELKILEFFAESISKNPKELKENLLSLSLTERAKTLAFINVRIPALYKDIIELLEVEE